MDVKKEIKKYSLKAHKPILLFLFERYHNREEWFFVADCRFEKYGVLSYESNRVWFPTEEGIMLYAALTDPKINEIVENIKKGLD